MVKRVFFLFLPLGIVLGSFAADLNNSPKASLGSNEIRAESLKYMHALQAEKIRQQVSLSATNLLVGSVMTPKAESLWRDLLSGTPSNITNSWGIPSALVSDFFVGASTIFGAYNSHGAVFAYCNPFWDVLLFVETTGGELPEPVLRKADKSQRSASSSLLGNSGGVELSPVSARGKMAKIRDFFWIDGDSFRDKKFTVLPSEPYSVALWRRYVATIEKFKMIYPDTGSIISSKYKVCIDKTLKGKEISQIRRGILSKIANRLYWLDSFQENAIYLNYLDFCSKLLNNGNKPALKYFFDSPYHVSFCKQLVDLPSGIRDGFVPFGMRKKSGDVLFLFVNRNVTTFYATVTFPEERIQTDFNNQEVSTNSVKYIQMELYDLATSNQLLDCLKK